MAPFHFISYSAVDGLDLALRLCDELQSGPPVIETWLDKRRLQVGPDWDRQVVEAIRDCESLILIMTPDSVDDASVCKNEWVQALKYKKPILLVRAHPGVEAPFRLNSRQYVDFVGSFETGLAKLRKDLLHLSTPRGVLQALTYRLGDAQRELRRATDPNETARIRDEIEQLQRQIAKQKRLVQAPEQEAQRTESRILAVPEREQEPERSVGGAERTRLERSIFESHDIIRDYERIRQTSDRPEEKLRARRVIDEQWKLIRGYLDEYLRVSDGTLPEPLAEIAAHFRISPTTTSAAGSGQQGGSYHVHIDSASGVAIGDRAQVVHQEGPRSVDVPSGGWNTQAVRELLSAALDDHELTVLCFDHFPAVYEALGADMGKQVKIQSLVAYCVRQDCLADLIRYIQDLNPAQYRRFQGQLRQRASEEG